MKQLIRAIPICLVALGFLLSFSALAQVQTARPNVNVSLKCKGYYEYLPQGYDPAGTTTYPLLLFISGIGEFGNGGTQLANVLKNGPPKLINAGTFPTSFTAGGQTHKFIVITPQFTSTPVTADDVEAVLSYMIAHYKVNLNRVYLTGLSYGGGLCFAYTGNAKASYAARVAAIVPIATPLPDGGYDTIYARSRRIAASNVPVYATHNSGDTPDSAARTIAYINNINLAPAPNPLATDTIFNVGGHDAWSKSYDINFRRKGYNIYEWMLLHQKGSAPPAPNLAPKANAGADKTMTLPTNSVTLTGSGTDADGSIVAYSWTKVSGPVDGTITSPASNTTTLTGLVRGIYTFRLVVSDNVSAKAIDDVKVTVNPAAGTKDIQVNIYGGSSAYSNTTWNNWNVGTVAATNVTSPAFKYLDGTVSTVTATLSATTAVKDNGSTYGSGLPTVAPTGVLRHGSQHNALRTLTLQGLSPAKTYNLEFYASYYSTSSNNNTIFTINGVPVSINVYSNFSRKAAFANITPNASGQITVSIDKTGTYNYLNGFIISESTGTPPPPPATSKYVKVNLFGGTNSYSNTEWNNWNVTASLTASALKYADATTSTVNAVLSSSAAIGDNGATYGGTMAPPEVLRYSSNGNVTRTLTLSGLSTAKTYSLELYASRSNTGNSTIFTIGSTSITIVTDNNKTNKAEFTGLVPNTSGQIIVTIARTASYNYLNGFMLTENSSTGTTIKAGSVTATGERVAEQQALTSGIAIFPNPVNSQMALTLNNPYTGVVHVQLTDAMGRSSKELRFVKNQQVLQQTVPVADLPKGTYFVNVQSGTQRQTMRIVKL